MKTLIIKKHRKAIAMIELIFAIVVIGIALLSVPNLITTSTKSSFVALQQESINEASTKLNSILSYYWDEADADTEFIDPILKTTNSSSVDLDEYNSSGRRKGTPQDSHRSFIRADGARLSASTTLGLDTNDSGVKDDIDDFNGESVSLAQIETSTNEYVDTAISITTNINYVADANGNFSSQSISYNPNLSTPATGTTNIKAIKVTLTSTSGVDELKKTIVLRAFSCNIGAIELAEREF